MYSFVVILASMFHIIRCASDVTDYVRSYGKKELFRGLFDRVELPHDDVLPMLNGKIFKGRRVSIREHPYVASIRRNVAHYLTGCILTKNIIITVAHPLNNVSVAELGVVVGENYSDRGSMMLTVILMIVHTGFNPSTLDNDIALLRTFEDITYKGSAKSIPLVRNTLSITGRKAFVTGWGRCDRTNEVSLPPSVLCLGVAREKNPMANCMAVPGAPLVVAANLVGILSWGFGCGHTKDLPLIYMSTEYYLPWLANNISVLRRISKVYLLKLFQAKRAYILKQWLNLTRIVPPRPDKGNGKNMAILLVDSELAKLYGDVYDIRDFLFNGIHHKYKTKVYKKLRDSFALESIEKLKLEAIKESFKKRNDSLRPFMSEHSEESDFEPFIIATDDDKQDNVESQEEYEG